MVIANYRDKTMSRSHHSNAVHPFTFLILLLMMPRLFMMMLSNAFATQPSDTHQSQKNNHITHDMQENIIPCLRMRNDISHVSYPPGTQLSLTPEGFGLKICHQDPTSSSCIALRHRVAERGMEKAHKNI